MELEQLYTDYVHCLDTDELEHWPEFFTEDCFYRVTSAENYEAGLQRMTRERAAGPLG